MTSKHTPGPWTAEIRGKSGPINFTIRGGTNAMGLETRPCVAQYVQGKDARLIAAAPELLAALRAVAAICEHSPAAVDALGFQNVRAIGAAIAKAEGK